MADITFHVQDNTDEIMAKIDEKIGLALELMGEVVEGYAKDDCPVDTGLLRNSITHAVSGQGTSVTSYHADRGSTGKAATSAGAGTVRVGRYSGVVGDPNDKACYVGSNVEYAPFVEFRDMSHQVGKAHFLRDAGQNHIDELRDVAQKTLKSL